MMFRSNRNHIRNHCPTVPFSPNHMLPISTSKFLHKRRFVIPHCIPIYLTIALSHVLYLLTANIEKMICVAQQFSLFGKSEIPLSKGFKFLIGHRKVGTLFNGFHQSVHTCCCYPFDRLLKKKFLKLCNVLSCKQLLFEVPYLIILWHLLEMI